ncbi:MAG: thiS [Bacteroidetes bacterium]|jgi:sulfur carrier protein|nr:thiS [Bacteroidota bacterium]MDF2451059.1 thiS [Bacteroidota bacterium]
MEITLNDKNHSLTENSSLYDLVLAQLGDKQKGIAVAVNDTVIPKSQWETYLIKSNDQILIIKATQGG